jgi:DNA-binding SARP family transcriptional activator/pimeloyl-ACP methyl ester carboxylesterase
LFLRACARSCIRGATLAPAGRAAVERVGTLVNVRFAVLGTLEVWDDEVPVAIPARMERLLLTVLLTNAGSFVATDVLVEQLWGDDAPRSAVKTLQTYVLHLRRFLGPRLRTEPAGYRLCLGDNECDLETFGRKISDGRLELARGRPADAARLLGDALARWRGRPFAEFSDHKALDVEATRLDDLRLAASEDWVEARLDAGEFRGVASELEVLVAANPFRERLWSLLVRSLYLSGRQADALQAYRRARNLLLDELGIEPGPELRATEAAVLRQDAALGSTADRAASVPTRYALTKDGIEIAYRAIGDGDRAVVFVLEWTMNVELIAELDALRPLLDSLASLGRLVIVQRRDTGISGRDDGGGFATPEGCVLDLDAILDDVGAKRAAVVGWGHGGQVALAFAAARPERVTHVVAITSYPRLTATTDHPHGLSTDFLEAFLALMADKWGLEKPLFPIFGPDVAYDPALITQVTRMERLTLTPARAVEMQRLASTFDVRSLLPDVHCPVLVVGLRESLSGAGNARALADLLPSASYVELPGYFVPTAAESDAIADAVVEFLGADGSALGPPT